MQLPLPTGSYKHPSRPTNYQILINYFSSAPGPSGRGSGATLLPTAGSKLLKSIAPEEVRFLKNINGKMYVIVGNMFYSMDINVLTETVVLTEIGELNTSAGVVIGTNNPTQVILLDGTDGYIYNYIFAGTVAVGTIGGASGNTYTLTINGVSIFNAFAVTVPLDPAVLSQTINNNTATTKVTATYTGGLLTLTGDPSISSITVAESGTGFVSGTNGITVDPGVFSGALVFQQFQQISDPDFLGGSHVVYIDGYFIYNQKDSQKFWFSQPNEGRVWNALDVATAESKPDNIIALGSYKGELWVFGNDSIEVWADAANPIGSPFSKQVGSDIGIGCKAPYSVTQVNDLLAWVDSRGFIVQSNVSALLRDQSSGYTLTKISDEALDAELATYTRLDDAIGCTYVDRGHIMLEMTFPTAKKTWVFDYTTSTWHERNVMNENIGTLEHSFNQFCDTYQNVTICGGVRNGNVYILSADYFYDDETPITRMFTTQHLNTDFTELGFDNLELKLETGFAESGGYLAHTQVMMQFSHDSGYTWSWELLRPIGSKGQYDKRIIWNMLGSSNQWLLLFKITAPIKHAVVDLNVSISKEIQ